MYTHIHTHTVKRQRQKKSVICKLNYYISITPSCFSSPSAPEPKAQILQDIKAEAGVGRAPGPDPPQRAAEPQLKLDLFLWRAGSPRGSGPPRGSGLSASAEDLLERFVKKGMTPQHQRSRSSPTVETLSQVPLTHIAVDIVVD